MEGWKTKRLAGFAIGALVMAKAARKPTIRLVRTIRSFFNAKQQRNLELAKAKAREATEREIAGVDIALDNLRLQTEFRKGVS